MRVVYFVFIPIRITCENVVINYLIPKSDNVYCILAMLIQGLRRKIYAKMLELSKAWAFRKMRLRCVTGINNFLSLNLAVNPKSDRCNQWSHEIKFTRKWNHTWNRIFFWDKSTRTKCIVSEAMRRDIFMIACRPVAQTFWLFFSLQFWTPLIIKSKRCE